MKFFIYLCLFASTLVGCSNSKVVNSEDTETINGYEYEKGSNKAYTGTIRYKNGSTKDYKDGKVVSKTTYHENGKPATTKYRDENGHYYKRIDYDKNGNKINEEHLD